MERFKIHKLLKRNVPWTRIILNKQIYSKFFFKNCFLKILYIPFLMQFTYLTLFSRFNSHFSYWGYNPKEEVLIKWEKFLPLFPIPSLELTIVSKKPTLLSYRQSLEKNLYIL